MKIKNLVSVLLFGSLLGIILFLSSCNNDSRFIAKKNVAPKYLSFFNDSIIKQINTNRISHESNKSSTCNYIILNNDTNVSILEYLNKNSTSKIDNIKIQNNINEENIITPSCCIPSLPEEIEQNRELEFNSDISVFISGKSSVQKIDKKRNTVFFNIGSSIKKIVRNKKTIIISGEYGEITICNNNKAVIRIKYKEEVKSKILIITLKNDKIYFITVYSNRDFDDSILDIFKPTIIE